MVDYAQAFGRQRHCGDAGLTLIPASLIPVGQSVSQPSSLRFNQFITSPNFHCLTENTKTKE